jgi:hypothetical protein
VASALRQGLAHGLVNAKLIVFNGAHGAFGTSFEICASRLMVPKASARGDAGGLRCHASGLHPKKHVFYLVTNKTRGHKFVEGE